MGDSRPDRSVDVALAEFEALRSELVANVTSQRTFVGLGVTAIGIIAGFVAKEGGSDRLLLTIPPVSLLVVLLYSGATYRIALIGSYIRLDLWPFLTERFYPPPPSWEVEAAERRLGNGGVLKALVVDLPPMAIFFLAGGFALSQVPQETFWWVDVALLILALAVAIALGCLIRRDARDLRPTSP